MPNHHAEILKFAFSWHQTQQTHDHARKIKINEIIYTHFSNYHHQRRGTIIISTIRPSSNIPPPLYWMASMASVFWHIGSKSPSNQKRIQNIYFFLDLSILGGTSKPINFPKQNLKIIVLINNVFHLIEIFKSIQN